MRPFNFEQAVNPSHASRLGRDTGQGQTEAGSQFLAGGTTLIDLMKLDVLKPKLLIDLGALDTPSNAVEVGLRGLRLNAFAKMSTVADDKSVLAHYPAIAQSLQLAASPQIRNMATLGGNVLQKTRCPYYRDPSWQACNKRSVGSGCAALDGYNRNHAVLGTDSSCIAQYPGDFGVALIALDAQIELMGSLGVRRMPFGSLHVPAAGRPDIETSLLAGEIITSFHVPAGAWTARSLYLKVRDRASYEFAISSAAVALDLDGDIVRNIRIGLGGIAYRPWRAKEAEFSLMGKPLTESNALKAAEAALVGAITHGHNDYKPELARRTLVRALLQAQSMPVTNGGA